MEISPPELSKEESHGGKEEDGEETDAGGHEDGEVVDESINDLHRYKYVS